MKFLQLLACLLTLSCQTPSVPLASEMPAEKSRYERPVWVMALAPDTLTGISRLASLPGGATENPSKASPLLVSVRRGVTDVQLAVKQEEEWMAVRVRHLLQATDAPNVRPWSENLRPEIIDIYFERLERNSSYDLYVLLQLAEPGNLE